MKKHQEISNLLENKQPFKKWLESKAPKTKVGFSTEGQACPIYRFLKQNNINNVKAVLSYGVRLKENEDELIENPYWVKKFIRAVDEEDKVRSISAKKALTILETI